MMNHANGHHPVDQPVAITGLFTLDGDTPVPVALAYDHRRSHFLIVGGEHGGEVVADDFLTATCIVQQGGEPFARLHTWRPTANGLWLLTTYKGLAEEFLKEPSRTYQSYAFGIAPYALAACSRLVGARSLSTLAPFIDAGNLISSDLQ